jgi:hypothetical protein
MKCLALITIESRLEGEGGVNRRNLKIITLNPYLIPRLAVRTRNNYRNIKLSHLLAKSIAFKECEINKRQLN